MSANIDMDALLAHAEIVEVSPPANMRCPEDGQLTNQQVRLPLLPFHMAYPDIEVEVVRPSVRTAIIKKDTTTTTKRTPARRLKTRPENGFVIFSNRHRPTAQGMFPTYNNRQLSPLFSEWYSALTVEQKQPYQTLASKLYTVFKRAFPNAARKLATDKDKCSAEQMIELKAQVDFDREFDRLTVHTDLMDDYVSTPLALTDERIDDFVASLRPEGLTVDRDIDCQRRLIMQLISRVGLFVETPQLQAFHQENHALFHSFEEVQRKVRETRHRWKRYVKACGIR